MNGVNEVNESRLFSTMSYQRGDWIVHRHYGIGQVRGVEEKRIGDHQATYLKVKIDSSLLWLPLKADNDGVMRPVASAQELEQALAVLQRPPQAMNAKFKRRKALIQAMSYDSPLIAIARLVRDLRARRRERKLSMTEQEALKQFTNHLVAEWATCREQPRHEIWRKLYLMLDV
jgi:RNA polymerase-interacting CarD/CdnL/TRCF family regulator